MIKSMVEAESSMPTMISYKASSRMVIVKKAKLSIIMVTIMKAKWRMDCIMVMAVLNANNSLNKVNSKTENLPMDE